MNVALALQNAWLIRRGFRARKSQLAMASLLGADCVLRYVTGRLEIEDIERRIGRLTGGRAAAIRGAHPALAMDCDSARDIAYARTWISTNAMPVSDGSASRSFLQASRTMLRRCTTCFWPMTSRSQRGRSHQSGHAECAPRVVGDNELAAQERRGVGDEERRGQQVIGNDAMGDGVRPVRRHSRQLG